MDSPLLVVEDDAFTRLSLVAALRAENTSVGLDTGNFNEAVTYALHHFPSAALIDIHLGSGPNGIDLAKELRRNDPKVGIVFLTSVEDPRVLGPQAAHTPAGTQYLTKKSITDISLVISAINRSRTSKTVRATRTESSAFGHLTDQQIETLRLVADGLSNAEIAKRRFVKEASVEMTISRLARSLGVTHDTAMNQRVNLARIYFRSSGIDSSNEH